MTKVFVRKLIRALSQTKYDYLVANVQIDRWNLMRNTNYQYVYHCDPLSVRKLCWKSKACMCVPHHKRPMYSPLNTLPESDTDTDEI